VKCPWCAKGIETREIGYVPLYRELDGKPCFVVVHDHARPQLDVLKLHVRVMVGRGADKNDTVYVLKALAQNPMFQSHLPERFKPADLTRTLLTVWGIADLAEWYAVTEGVTDMTVPKLTASELANPAPKTVPVASEELAGAFDLAEQRAKDRAEQAARNAEWVREHASKNGKPNNGKPH
jgi:hypothetical protein